MEQPQKQSPKGEQQPEPSLTRDEMSQLAKNRVEALRLTGKLPSFDQVLSDVQDMVREAHPSEMHSRKTVADVSAPVTPAPAPAARAPHSISPEELAWRRKQTHATGSAHHADIFDK
jgi:hypothetical protein